MGEAIILTSFGVLDKAERERTLGAIRAELAAGFPGCEILEAYTSAFMRRKIQEREGLSIPSLPDLLAGLAQAGTYRRVLILPTHLTPGEEYEQKIVGPYEECRHKFPELLLAQPALGSPDDDAPVVEAILQWLAPRPQEELVLMGHGSPHRPNPAYGRLQSYVDSQHLPIHIGVLEETDKPTLGTVLGRLAATGHREVLLAPLLLTSGSHVHKEMAGDGPDSWKSRLSQAGYHLRLERRGLASIPAFRALYARKAKALLAGDG